MARLKRHVIKSVSFRSNVALNEGKYNHIHIEASADVPTGELPGAVLDTLKLFVRTELKRAKEGEVRPEPVGRFRLP